MEKKEKEVASSDSLANEGYDPDESRLPAGQPGGGQWTSAGAAGLQTGKGQADVARREMPERAKNVVIGQHSKDSTEKKRAPQKPETKEQEAHWTTEGDYPTGDARFDKFIKFVFAHEIALNKHGKVITEDVSGDGGKLTKYGIDKSSHPNVDITGLNKQKATAIYFSEWNKAGISRMKYPLGEVYFDAKVNGGGNALMLASGGDSNKFLDLRDERFRGLVDKNPKNARFLDGWLQRTEDLRQYIRTNPTEPKQIP